MSLHGWLQNLRSVLAPNGNRRKQGKRPPRVASHRLNVEVLEDRSVPAFIAAGTYAVDPYGVVTADFNGDGKLDLATVGTDVGVLLGNGDGTFQDPQHYYAGELPLSIAAGDFNGDGHVDLAVGSNYFEPYNYITVLRGHGDGTFEMAGGGFAGGATGDIAVGDFDGDGIIDLAASGGLNPFAGEVIVLLGNGDGNLAYSDAHPILGGLALAIVSADFNRDGNLDLAWAELEAGMVGVRLGNGDGTFQAAPSLDSVNTPYSVAVADLNGDGKPDLVTTSQFRDSASVMLGNGDGTFQAAQTYTSGGIVGDFNGDGSLDAILGGGLLPGTGNDAGTYPADGGLETLGDFNGDGLWDIARANYVTVSILLNDGIWDDSPPPPPPPPTVSIGDVAITEGNSDTAAATFTVTLSAASTEAITVAFATGNGTATAGSDYQAASGTLTIPAGQTSATFTVAIQGDRVAEPTEAFAVNLSAATNATIGDAQGIGTIVDNEPRISISDVTRYEGRKGKSTSFTFTVTLSAAYDQPVTMSFQTVNGTATTSNNDYVAKTGTITFAPGETTRTITIQVKGDRNKEGNEIFYLDLFNLSSNALFTKNRGIGTILNDD